MKAFNQLPAPVPAAQGRRVVFIPSDSPESGARIAQLTETLGLSPVQLGKIGEGGCLIQVPNAPFDIRESASNVKSHGEGPVMIWFLEDYRDDVVLVVWVQHFGLPDPVPLEY